MIEFVIIPYIVNKLIFPILLLNIKLIFRMPLFYGGTTGVAHAVAMCVNIVCQKTSFVLECAFCED